MSHGGAVCGRSSPGRAAGGPWYKTPQEALEKGLRVWHARRTKSVEALLGEGGLETAQRFVNIEDDCLRASSAVIGGTASPARSTRTPSEAVRFEERRRHGAGGLMFIIHISRATVNHQMGQRLGDHGRRTVLAPSRSTSKTVLRIASSSKSGPRRDAARTRSPRSGLPITRRRRHPKAWPTRPSSQGTLELGEGWRSCPWPCGSRQRVLGDFDWKTLYQDRHRFYMWLHAYIDAAELHYCAPTVPLLQIQDNADPIKRNRDIKQRRNAPVTCAAPALFDRHGLEERR